MANNKYQCGPWDIKIPLGDNFKDACIIHDQMYEQGVDRAKADDIFLMNMLNTARNKPYKYWRFIVAYIYHYSVCILWYKFYNKW